MRYLRTNTATRVTVGPFLDKTDGITPEVALTVTSEKLTFVCDTAGVPTLILDVAPTGSGGANDMVHITGDDAGFYDLELAAADVNYLGRAMLSLNDVATHCPVFHEFMIVPAMMYDSQVLGSDRLDVNATHFEDVATTTALAAALLAFLKLDWTGITGESARSILNALRMLRNKWVLTGSTLSVKKEDDSTEAWASTVSTDASADPITGSDPA